MSCSSHALSRTARRAAQGGDPFLFGRGGEEAAALAEAGVDFDVVPGVTSALAGPAYAGIPATDRNLSSSVRIYTGQQVTQRSATDPDQPDVNRAHGRPHARPHGEGDADGRLARRHARGGH